MLYIYTKKKKLQEINIETSVLFNPYVGKTFYIQLESKQNAVSSETALYFKIQKAELI